MSIKDIKKFIDWCVEGDSTIEQWSELIDNQRKNIENQIKLMQENPEILNYKHRYYETAKEAGTCEIHNNQTADDIPRNSEERISEENVINYAKMSPLRQRGTL